jgi:hypothetical protein
MSAVLIEKIRKARQQDVVINEITFTCRRPTDLEMVDWAQLGLERSEILKRFVVGWRGVNESDLIPGGTAEPIEFDTNLFMEWVADRPDTWAPLIETITNSYKKHQYDLEQALKKPCAG